MKQLELVVTTVDDESTESDAQAVGAERRRRIRWIPLTTCILLPALALLLAVGAGYLKWQGAMLQQAQVAGAESVQAATEGTVALLSYRPDTVAQDLEAARSRLTGQFSETYGSLTHDVVIPGAQQKQISATATVPAAAAVSASADHAEVLLFVNQTVTVGKDAPTATASSVRVGLEKVDGRWLISQFDPV